MAQQDVVDTKAKKKRNKNKKKSGPRTPTEGPDALVAHNTENGDQDELDDEPDTNGPTPPHTSASADTDNNGNPSDEGHQLSENSLHNGTTTPGTTSRLDALESERNALKDQVSDLRRSLEALQVKHAQELQSTTEQLENATLAKDTAEEQYTNLLGKVNTIRSQLGDRLKADAEELNRARAQIQDSQDENTRLQQANDDKDETIQRLTQQQRSHAEELTSLRSRTHLSTSNWSKERDDLNSQLAYAREEFESAKQAMQDWEVLATDYKKQRDHFAERVAQMGEQLNVHNEAYERATSERDKQQNTAYGLQRALQDMQQARKTELREMVESTQTQLDSLRKQVDEAVKRADESADQLQSTRAELQRALPFEKEVREKNLLIGKLRHEAVILNDHLTKALKFLKRGKPEDNVDRQIVTNHLLHFLALDRSDPKKFQVLQLIAALLGWSEEQREQAGLARPGASNAQLRIPLSPFRRTPSTPALASDFAAASGGFRNGSISGGRTSRESLAELWSDFLEREAEEGGAGGGGQRDRSGIRNPESPSALPDAGSRSEMPGLGIRQNT